MPESLEALKSTMCCKCEKCFKHCNLNYFLMTRKCVLQAARSEYRREIRQWSSQMKSSSSTKMKFVARPYWKDFNRATTCHAVTRRCFGHPQTITYHHRKNCFVHLFQHQTARMLQQRGHCFMNSASRLKEKQQIA